MSTSDYPDSWRLPGWPAPTEEATIGDRPVSGLRSGTGAYYSTTTDSWTNGDQPEPPYPTTWPT
ncbi:hypothetical protein NJB1507_05010 [Mycobacterium marinum]|uniref:hypothetical protein n=1 Tax=Mycobacterium marinum TaxID=1781 RepID=UPI0021C432C3|nr:hypothetical protein [Mycobacterium marinum]GJO16702.1 hypothetical protein NJB1507_05010 [Mycobacterium marinum]